MLLRKRPDLLDVDASIGSWRRQVRLTSHAMVALASPVSSKQRMCGACLEPLTVDQEGDAMVFTPCGHAMHAECGSAMLASYIQQAKPMPFACSCQGPLGVCRGVMGTPSPMSLEIDPGVLPRAYAPCPQCGCFVFCLATITTPARVGKGHAVCCSGCQTRFCHTCLREPHAPELECAAVIAHTERSERIQAAHAALDAVSLDKLASEMARQYAAITANGGVPSWAVVERLLKASPPTQVRVVGLGLGAGHGLPIPPILHRGRPISSLSGKELVVLAQRELSVMTMPPLKTVLELAVEQLGLHEPGGPGGPGDPADNCKFCPRCFVRIQRTTGCPSMRCPMRNCGMLFCYECLGPQHTHDVCSRQVDRAALEAAATGAGVAPAAASAIVAGLALVSDEDEHFAAILARRPDRIEELNALRNRRNVRLIPLTVAMERYMALTEDGVTAPPQTVEAARSAIVNAIDREGFLRMQMAGHVRAHNQLARNDLAALASTPDIRRYAQLRVTIAKERARLVIVATSAAACRNTNDASLWATQAHATLAQARKTLLARSHARHWLLAGEPNHAGVTFNDVRFEVGHGLMNIIEGKPRVILMRANANGELDNLVAVNGGDIAAVIPEPQPGQFSEAAVDALSTLVEKLVRRVLDAAGQAVLVGELSGLKSGLKVRANGGQTDPWRLRVGDVVVPGPHWPVDEDHVNYGVVSFISNVSNHVTWLTGPHSREVAASRYMHTATVQQVVRAPNVSTAWRDVRELLVALAPNFTFGADRRALAFLDAAFAPVATTRVSDSFMDNAKAKAQASWALCPFKRPTEGPAALNYLARVQRQATIAEYQNQRNNVSDDDDSDDDDSDDDSLYDDDEDLHVPFAAVTDPTVFGSRGTPSGPITKVSSVSALRALEALRRTYIAPKFDACRFWACHQCTLVNSVTLTRCTACAAIRRPWSNVNAVSINHTTTVAGDLAIARLMRVIDS